MLLPNQRPKLTTWFHCQLHSWSILSRNWKNDRAPFLSAWFCFHDTLWKLGQNLKRFHPCRIERALIYSMSVSFGNQRFLEVFKIEKEKHERTKNIKNREKVGFLGFPIFFSFFCSYVFVFFFSRFLRVPFLLILLCFPILRGFLCFPISFPICFLCFPFFLEVLSVFLFFFLFFSRCFVISFFSYCFPIRSHFFVIVFPVFLRGSFLYSFSSFCWFLGWLKMCYCWTTQLRVLYHKIEVVMVGTFWLVNGFEGCTKITICICVRL